MVRNGYQAVEMSAAEVVLQDVGRRQISVWFVISWAKPPRLRNFKVPEMESRLGHSLRAWEKNAVL
jgi:hypothetical protein